MTGWLTTVDTKAALGVSGSPAVSNSSCSAPSSLLGKEERMEASHVSHLTGAGKAQVSTHVGTVGASVYSAVPDELLQQFGIVEGMIPDKLSNSLQVTNSEYLCAQLTVQ